MKVQCELCREIVVGELAVVGDAIEVHCPACDQTFTVEVKREPAPVRRAPRAGEDAMTCPKCGDAQPQAKACRTSGLLAERMATYEAPTVETAPELVAAWETLEGTWEDPGAHRALLQQVTELGAYPWAAQRYRAVARVRPDDRIAAEQLARISRMSEASMRAAATRRDVPEPTPYKNVILLLGALIVLLMLATFVAVLAPRFFGGDDPKPKAKQTQPAEPKPAKPKPRPANQRK
jgi:hypothetical protein